MQSCLCILLPLFCSNNCSQSQWLWLYLFHYTKNNKQKLQKKKKNIHHSESLHPWNELEVEAWNAFRFSWVGASFFFKRLGWTTRWLDYIPTRRLLYLVWADSIYTAIRQYSNSTECVHTDTPLFFPLSDDFVSCATETDLYSNQIQLRTSVVSTAVLTVELAVVSTVLCSDPGVSVLDGWGILACPFSTPAGSPADPEQRKGLCSGMDGWMFGPCNNSDTQHCKKYKLYNGALERKEIEPLRFSVRENLHQQWALAGAQ